MKHAKHNGERDKGKGGKPPENRGQNIGIRVFF
jgi:hypothetical protein